MEPAGKFARFFGLLLLFYGLPLLFLWQVNSGWTALTISFLLIFPLGYYFIWMMMHGDLLDLRIDPDDMRMTETAGSAPPEATGWLEEAPFEAGSDLRNRRIRTLGRGFIYHLIPFLLLMLLLLFFTGLRKTNELRNLPENMGDAIRITGDAMELVLRVTAPSDLPLYLAWKTGETAILNVRGSYDHAERVLDPLQLQFQSLQGFELNRRDISGFKVIFVNCPGKIPGPAAEKIQQAVQDGAWLFTTDWSIRYLLPAITPGFVAPAGRTGNALYPITAVDRGNPLCRDAVPEGNEPHWWVFFSDPIKVLRSESVEVLLECSELGEQFNAPPLAVSYRYGRGRVIHVIGHFYQQVAAGGSGDNALSFVTGPLKVPAARLTPAIQSALEKVPAIKFIQAYSIMRLIANVLIEKKRTN